MVSAQIMCTITHGEHVAGNMFWGYEELTCKKNICVATARTVPDNSTIELGFPAILRSDDGGQTWETKDIGISDTNFGISRIDVVDSLNIFVEGVRLYNGNRSFSLLRSTDGGTSWQRVWSGSSMPSSISFSTKLNGIINLWDSLAITSDGGDHWTAVPFANPEGLSQCQAYSANRYLGFSSNAERLYKTEDAWSTFDSTNPIVSDPRRSLLYLYASCQFGSGDTVLAYGSHEIGTSLFPCMARTIDGGQHWTTVFDDTMDGNGSIDAISDVDRDTIVAAVGAWTNKTLWSMDNGITWEIDTLTSNDTGFLENECSGIGINPAGEIVASINDYYPAPFRTGLILGRHALSSVKSNTMVHDALPLFPNPATLSVSLSNSVPGETIIVLDLLGREVLRSIVPESGILRLDVSDLVRGTYTVISEHHGAFEEMGRMVLQSP